ncbi:hypothetical protein NMG60_11029721 [Bertholletia excelsa]
MLAKVKLTMLWCLVAKITWLLRSTMNSLS